LAHELQVPHYLNLGVSGLRAHEIRATQLAPALAFEPDLALVVGGGNDAFSARYTPDRVDEELTAMITALQAAGADVITLGMFNVSYSPVVADWLRPGLRARMTTLSERTRALAERLGTIHVHLTDHPLSTDPALYSPDGRHGTARSDAIAAAETIRRLSAELPGFGRAEA
jgi:lysophospholipase L1-like esterase